MIEWFDKLVSFVILAVTWLIVQPLKTSIETLKDSVNGLARTMENIQSDNRELHLNQLDTHKDTKSNTRRIEDLEVEVKNMQQRCYYCTRDKQNV